MAIPRGETPRPFRGSARTGLGRDGLRRRRLAQVCRLLQVSVVRDDGDGPRVLADLRHAAGDPAEEDDRLDVVRLPEDEAPEVLLTAFDGLREADRFVRLLQVPGEQ